LSSTVSTVEKLGGIAAGTSKRYWNY
jgi:hypothetical protein